MKTLQLPWVPSGGTGNHTTGTRGKKRFTTPAVKAYREEVAVRILQEKQRLDVDGIEPPYVLSVQYWFPQDKRRHGDEDNLQKVWMDALVCGGWIEDDKPSVITSRTMMEHLFYDGLILPNGFVISGGNVGAHDERDGLIFVGLGPDKRFEHVEPSAGFPFMGVKE